MWGASDGEGGNEKPPPLMVDGTAGLPPRPRERAGGCNPTGRARGWGGAVDWPPRLRPAAAAPPTPRPRVCWPGVVVAAPIDVDVDVLFLRAPVVDISPQPSPTRWSRRQADRRGQEGSRGSRRGGGRALRGKKRRGKGRARADGFGGGGHTPRMVERGIPTPSPDWR
jgi:hypothetical protein